MFNISSSFQHMIVAQTQICIYKCYTVATHHFLQIALSMVVERCDEEGDMWLKKLYFFSFSHTHNWKMPCSFCYLGNDSSLHRKSSHLGYRGVMYNLIIFNRYRVVGCNRYKGVWDRERPWIEIVMEST